MRDRILVTGANGFIGSLLVQTLVERDLRVRAAVRSTEAAMALRRAIGGLPVETAVVGSISDSTNWRAALEDVTSVVHLAGVAHSSANEEVYRRVNVLGTRALARASESAGVNRVVFLSSVKASGDATNGEPYIESQEPHPSDAYGLSKLEAEQVLADAANNGAFEVVVLRCPLVYGPGVRANFLNLLRAVDRELPLPFASVHNRRSLIFVGNLVHALILSLSCPTMRHELFHVADDPPRSTPELIRALAAALGRKPRLLHVPPALLRIAGSCTGQSRMLDRLLNSLEVDTSRLRQALGFIAPFSFEAGIAATAAWYRASQSGAAG